MVNIRPVSRSCTAIVFTPTCFGESTPRDSHPTHTNLRVLRADPLQQHRDDRQRAARTRANRPHARRQFDAGCIKSKRTLLTTQVRMRLKLPMFHDSPIKPLRGYISLPPILNMDDSEAPACASVQTKHWPRLERKSIGGRPKVRSGGCAEMCSEIGAPGSNSDEDRRHRRGSSQGVIGFRGSRAGPRHQI